MFYKEPITSDELYHYGVKGMKWGVRRKRKKTKNPAPGSIYDEKNNAVLRKAGEHSVASIKASTRARNKHMSGEDPTDDLKEAREQLKKSEMVAKKSVRPDEFLKSDWYLESKWTYEEVCEEIRKGR